MRENLVSKLRVPSCAKIEKVISCSEYGEIAAIITWNGNQLTFFRTDFLDLKRVAWYFAEKFSNKDYHEEIPNEVIKSIKQNGGFFLSKNFMTFSENGEVMSCEGKAITKVNYQGAKRLVQQLKVPELKADLMYGMIYDVLGKWLIETGTLTEEDWLNTPTNKSEQRKLLMRDCGGWNLNELLGNIFKMEWTQEKYGERNHIVLREGIPCTDGEGNYPARMRFSYSEETRYPGAVVRAFLYFK